MGTVSFHASADDGGCANTDYSPASPLSASPGRLLEIVNSSVQSGKRDGLLSQAEPGATTRPMLRLEPLPRPGGHWPGLLPLLLALLGTTWAGVQPLQLQEHRVPMPGGKGATG